MRRVAEIESLAAMAAFVDDGVGANGDGERLLRGIGGAEFGLTGQDARDVDLERDRRNALRRSTADRCPRCVPRWLSRALNR